MDFSKPDLYLIDSGYFIRYYDGAVIPNIYGITSFYYDINDKCLKEYVENDHTLTNSLGKLQLSKTLTNNVYITVNGRKSLDYVNSISNPYIIKADCIEDIQIDTNFGIFSYNYKKDVWNQVSKKGYNNVHIRGDYSYSLEKDNVIIRHKGIKIREIHLPEFYSCGFGTNYFVMKDKKDNLSFYKF